MTSRVDNDVPALLSNWRMSVVRCERALSPEISSSVTFRLTNSKRLIEKVSRYALSCDARLGDFGSQNWRNVSISPAAMTDPYFSVSARRVSSSDDWGEPGIEVDVLESDGDD